MLKVPIVAIMVWLSVMTPPSGRPPIAPLVREEPLRYEIIYDVHLRTRLAVDPRDRAHLDLRDVPFGMPIILQSTFSATDQGSLTAALWVDGKQDPTLLSRTRLDSVGPHHSSLAVLPIPRYQGYDLRWQVKFRTQVWNSRVTDERAMAEATWPREWPKDVAGGLEAQRYIESDIPLFKETVERVTNGRLRMVRPYLAAKELIRYSINNIQINGDAVRDGPHGEHLGLAVTGAEKAARSGKGTSNDLVCVCVAMLKAAGIPARPVIGLSVEDSRRGRLVTWAEFYLPEIGWIPFDPIVLRDEGVRSREVTARWEGLGTFEHYNKRIPLAFDFVPSGWSQPSEFAALWGWKVPGRPNRTVLHAVSFTITDLGPGTAD